jgi:hypothetical protein
MNLKRLLPVIAMVCLAAAAFAQGGADRGATEVTIKGKKVSIDYGRPQLKGRDMLGKATAGTVWRFGMNLATHIETTGELDIAGKKVPPGKYTLWAKKVSDTDWLLGFHPKTGAWGAPVLKEGYIAELPLKASTATDSVEVFTIALADNKGKANMKVQWGTLVLSGDFGVN